MRFLVVGCGSIGRRHAKNLLSLGQEVCVMDIAVENRRWAEENLSVRTYSELSEALASKPDAVLVCTPPSTHLEISLRALSAGCHLFIEKPIADRMEGLERLEMLAKRKNMVVLCACNMRFCTAIRKIGTILSSGKIGGIIYQRFSYGNYLPRLRPANYREYASKKIGGGIIKDCIHELDIACMTAGEVSSVSAIVGKASSLQLETGDSAEVVLRHKSGALTSFHADYFRPTYARNYEFIGERGAISWQEDDGGAQIEVLIDENGSTLVHRIAVPIAGYENEMYVRQMKHFIRCCKGKEKPVCGISGAAEVLKIALASEKSSQRGLVVRLR
ncbi:MAG: Gfo/Idh/MocA family oxidoreductase [Candidatus Micrarchaeota archaeon]|nr:Gfo/Idh/MocA family oxidoreductase [Candidatus Micrarchaeota archaeon]